MSNPHSQQSTIEGGKASPARFVVVGHNEYAPPIIEHRRRDARDAPRSALLSRDVFLFGRADGNDLVLDQEDLALSRCVGAIERHGDVWTVRRLTTSHGVRVETPVGTTLEVEVDRPTVLGDGDVIVVPGTSTGHEIRLSLPPPAIDAVHSAEHIRAGVEGETVRRPRPVPAATVGLRNAQRALLAALAAPFLRPELFDEKEVLSSKELVRLLRLNRAGDADPEHLARTVDSRISRLMSRVADALGVPVPDRNALVGLAISRGLVSASDFEHDENLNAAIADRARERGIES